MERFAGPPKWMMDDDAPGDEEFREYLNEMYARLQEFAHEVTKIPSGERGSFAWRRQLGLFWWHAREKTGLSRYQAAENSGVAINRVRLLEFGLARDDELNDISLMGYSQGLGDPNIYQQFIEQFRKEE